MTLTGEAGQQSHVGQGRVGVGQMTAGQSHAVEHCHNFLALLGRVFRSFDRSARRYLGLLEMAACVILLRSGFVS